MSWQERVEAYQKRQELAAQLTDAEKVKLAKEKIPPLVEILNRLNCQELLTQIRDEVWQVGKVVSSPNLDSLTPKTPIEAEVALIAKWPVFEPGRRSLVYAPEFYYPPRIRMHEERLAVTAKYKDYPDLRETEVIVTSSGSFGSSSEKFDLSDPNDQEVSRKLEEILIKDISGIQKRGISYVSDKAGEEKRVVEEIAKARVYHYELILPGGFEYLGKHLDEQIKEAVKVLLSQKSRDDETKKPKKSWVRRFFRRS